MGFLEGKIVEEKVFGGKVFPKTLLPTPTGTHDLAEMVRREREWLAEMLRQHGAILFRGFDVGSHGEFDRVVGAFEWDEMTYIGATSRLKLSDRVYTANEAPVDRPIGFHHEMSLFNRFPSKIFFFCMEPSPAGGETSILPSDIIVERMGEVAPEFVAKLEDEGFVFRAKTPSKPNPNKVLSTTWKQVLKTDDEEEAQRRATETFAYGSLKCNADGSGVLIFGPMSPIKEFEGKRVWFKSIVGYSDNEMDFDIEFADGRALPAEMVDWYKKILDDICVDLRWCKGDVLLVDNLTVQHARRPGKPPRVILVSVCK